MLALEQRVLSLLKAYKASWAVSEGGPGGYPVIISGEIWNVGMAPDRSYFASNGVSGAEVLQFCSYSLTNDLALTRNETATRYGRGWMEDPSGETPVTSEDEVLWLTNLVEAANHTAWGGKVALPSRPRPASND